MGFVGIWIFNNAKLSSSSIFKEKRVLCSSNIGIMLKFFNIVMKKQLRLERKLFLQEHVKLVWQGFFIAQKTMFYFPVRFRCCQGIIQFLTHLLNVGMFYCWNSLRTFIWLDNYIIWIRLHFTILKISGGSRKFKGQVKIFKKMGTKVFNMIFCRGYTDKNWVIEQLKHCG